MKNTPGDIERFKKKGWRKPAFLENIGHPMIKPV
jgi:hypothetical protein